MSFEWDEAKRAANLAKHGVDFTAVRLMFEGATLTAPDSRRDYGEPRFGAYGQVNGVVLFVVYTQRGKNRRIISARKAGTHEKETYFKVVATQVEDDER